MPTKQAAKPGAATTAPPMATSQLDMPQVPAPSQTVMSDADKREVLVRIAAYSFYERRGYVCGHELEDWLQAELEVDRELAAAQALKQKD